MAWDGSTTTSQDQAATTSFVSLKDTGGTNPLEIALNPGELVSALIEVTHGGTTDDAEVVMCKSPDGTTYESPGEAIEAGRYFYISSNNPESESNPFRHVEITGCNSAMFYIRKSGSTDTISVQVHYRGDGVSA